MKQTRRVNPKVYTKEYYLTDCTGHEEFKKTSGDSLEPRLQELIKYFKVKSGMRVLDIGCGRGEMVLFCAKNGADAVGIDYSKDAIKLAKHAQASKPEKLKAKMSFYTMDAKKMKFNDSSFDSVILTDVVEHLYPEELAIVFQEIKRVLKKNGTLVIHTAPNKWFNDFGYPYYSYPLSSFLLFFWNLISRKKYPNIARPQELRKDSHAIMHINEPTYFSLKNLYKTYRFQGEIISTNITAKKPEISMKDVIFNCLVFLHPLSKRFPYNVFFGSDFVSILTNKK